MSELSPEVEAPVRAPHRQAWQKPILKSIEACEAEAGFLVNPELPYSTS